jgi:hypothetical protein
LRAETDLRLGWGGQGEGPAHPPSVARAVAKKNSENGCDDVRTSVEPHSERIYLRATPAEIAALDFLALKWGASRSEIIRSMIVGAAMAQLDRLDEALDAEPSVDALVDVPSVSAWNE